MEKKKMMFSTSPVNREKDYELTKQLENKNELSMFDRFGNKIRKDDVVLVVFSTRSSYNIEKAVIVGFTPKMVKLETINYYKKTTIRMPHDIVKYNTLGEMI